MPTAVPVSLHQTIIPEGGSSDTTQNLGLALTKHGLGLKPESEFTDAQQLNHDSEAACLLSFLHFYSTPEGEL